MAVALATYGNRCGFIDNNHIFVHVYDRDWMTGNWYFMSETGITLPDRTKNKNKTKEKHNNLNSVLIKLAC